METTKVIDYLEQAKRRLKAGENEYICIALLDVLDFNFDLSFGLKRWFQENFRPTKDRYEDFYKGEAFNQNETANAWWHLHPFDLEEHEVKMTKEEVIEEKCRFIDVIMDELMEKLKQGVTNINFDEEWKR